MIEEGRGDGVYSAIGGRVVKVAEVLAGSTTDDLERLLAQLRRAETLQDSALAENALRTAGLPAASTSGGRADILGWITLLIAVVALVLQLRADGDAPSKDQIDHLIQIEQSKVHDDNGTKRA